MEVGGNGVVYSLYWLFHTNGYINQGLKTLST